MPPAMEPGFDITELGKFMRETVGRPVTKAAVWFILLVGGGVLTSILLDHIERIAERVGGSEVVVNAVLLVGLLFLLAFAGMAAYTLIIILLRRFWWPPNYDSLVTRAFGVGSAA